MASSAINKICQIVRLKRLMQRWKYTSLHRHDSTSGNCPSPSGHLPLYVGRERRRFVIPARFLNLPIFVALLNQAREEFGYQPGGVLTLPCEANLFELVLKFLERDEQRYGLLGLDEFVRAVSEIGFDTCKETAKVSCSQGFKPLMHKARV